MAEYTLPGDSRVRCTHSICWTEDLDEETAIPAGIERYFKPAASSFSGDPIISVEERTHTPECLASMERDQWAYDVFVARYGVTWCRKCHMSGIETSIYRDEPPEWCSHCIEQGRCPQCGGAFDVHTQEQCPTCNWHEAVEKPMPPWCSCRMNGEDECRDDLPPPF